MPRPDPFVRGPQRPGAKLNFGCGRDIRPTKDGWTNLDVAKLDGVDVVHDVFDTPYPFHDGRFTYILASHVIEHIPQRIGTKDGLILVMEELHRILAPDGLLHIKVPHPDIGAAAYLANPTHYRIIGPKTFLGFLGHPGTCVTYHTTARFRSIEHKANHRTRIFGGRINNYHIKKYLRLDNIKGFQEAYELEVLLRK